MYVLGLFYIPWWILWPLFVVFTYYVYARYKLTFFIRRGIVGPNPSVFLGNIREIVKKGVHRFDREYAERYGPYFGQFYGNYPVIVICDPEMIQEIAVNQFSKFSDRGEWVLMPKRWRKALMNSKGAKWKYLRTVIQPSFSHAKIKTMRPILKRCLDEFISSLDAKLSDTTDHVVEMHAVYKALTMDVICTTAFGIEVNSQRNPDNQFVKSASKVFKTGPSNIVIMLNFIFPDRFLREIIMFLSGDFVDKCAFKFLMKTVKEAIKIRKDTKSTFTDLLQQMLDTQNEVAMTAVSEDQTFEQIKKDGMSEEEIVINGIIFLAAGHETTTTLLTLLTHSLAAYPEFQEKLIEEIDATVGSDESGIQYDKIINMQYLDMFVQETLRMYPPVARTDRTPSQDIEIKGLKLKKGDDVVFSTHALHRNPLYWSDPDKFDPERFSPENKSKIVPYSFIPFGAGPRNCVGKKLALAEVKMAIVRLLQHVRVLPSPTFQNPPKISTMGGLMRPVDGMKLKLVRR